MRSAERKCYGKYYNMSFITPDRDCASCDGRPNCIVASEAEPSKAVKDDDGKRKVSLIIPEMLDAILPIKDSPAQIFSKKTIINLAKAAHAKNSEELIGHIGDAIKSGKMICQFDTDAVKLTSIAMEYGIEKYGRNNWKKGMEWSRLIDAGQRHLLAILNGEMVDGDSGNSHLSHFFGSVHMLLGNVTLNIGTNDLY